MGTRKTHCCRQCVGLAAVAVGAILFAPGSVWSWGRVGHHVSARFAEARLTPAAATAVRDLLDGQSLVDVSTWADEQREPGTATWHYVDVPISELRYNPKFCPSGGCVVSKIADFKRVLVDPKAVIFEDEAGRFWRYLHAYRKAWNVIVGK